MFARPLFLAALFALATVAAPAAQAFTFEDQGAGQKNSDTSMFYNGGKDQPLTSRLDGGGNSTVIKRGNSTIYFGGQGQTFDQRNNQNDYFNPSYLLGK